MFLPGNLGGIDLYRQQHQPGVQPGLHTQTLLQQAQLLPTRQQTVRLDDQHINGGTDDGQLIATQPLLHTLCHNPTPTTPTDTAHTRKGLSTSTNSTSRAIHKKRSAH